MYVSAARFKVWVVDRVIVMIWLPNERAGPFELLPIYRACTLSLVVRPLVPRSWA